MSVESVRFTDQVVAALAAGTRAYDAVLAALPAMAPAMPDTELDALARTTMGLALEFQNTTGTSILTDGPALARLALGTLTATIQARHGETEMNLPFLTANERGPLHFQITLTTARIATLALTEPPPPPHSNRT